MQWWHLLGKRGAGDGDVRLPDDRRCDTPILGGAVRPRSQTGGKIAMKLIGLTLGMLVSCFMLNIAAAAGPPPGFAQAAVTIQKGLNSPGKWGIVNPIASGFDDPTNLFLIDKAAIISLEKAGQ